VQHVDGESRRYGPSRKSTSSKARAEQAAGLYLQTEGQMKLGNSGEQQHPKARTRQGIKNLRKISEDF